MIRFAIRTSSPGERLHNPRGSLMGIFANLRWQRKGLKAARRRIYFACKSLRTLFSPPSKAEILGSAPSSRFPKWSIVFGCLSCFSSSVLSSREAREKSRTSPRARISLRYPRAFGLEFRLSVLKTRQNNYFSSDFMRVFFTKCESFDSFL